MANYSWKIENLVQEFYQKFLGTSASSLACVDILVMRQGLRLDHNVGLRLAALVTLQEIDNALCFIHSQRPRIWMDLMHFFFKKCCNK